MNENINLAEILKWYEGETFYCTLYGNVILETVNGPIESFPIRVRIVKPISYCFNLTPEGKYYNNYPDSEIVLFPSKDQRDWNKWIEERKTKVPKTWSEYVKIIPPKTTNDYKDYPFAVNNPVFVREDITPIEKSALALIKIHQLIDAGYGGNVTEEDWRNEKIYKWFLFPDLDKIKENKEDIFDITDLNFYCAKRSFAFYTREQAKEFISYPENVKLLKDYFMI